jgi:hypothetical protein
MAMEAWVFRPTSAAAGTVVSSLQTDGPLRGHEIAISSTGQVSLFAISTWDTNALHCTSTIGTIPVDAWSHTVASLQTGVFSLFVNGTQRPLTCSHNSLTGTTVSNQTFFIGQRPGGAYPFTGRIAEVALYSAPVTETTAKAHFDASALAASGATYDAAVAADSPTALWALDEQTGSTFSDSSANARTATLAAGTARLAAPALTASGSSASFDGSTYFTVPVAKSQVTGALSFEAWVRPTQVASQAAIMEKYDVGVSSSGFALRINGGGNVMFYAANAAGGVSVVSDRALVANQTYHIIGTVDGTSLKVYINGALEGTQASAVMPTSGSATIKIGARGDDVGTKFRGDLDNLAVYPVALDANRVAAHYQAGAANRSYAATVLSDSPGGYYQYTGASDSWSTGTAASGYAITDTNVVSSADANYEYVTWLHSDNGTIMQQRFSNGAPVGAVTNVGCCTPGSPPGAASFARDTAIGIRGGDNALYTRVTTDGTTSWNPAATWENRGTDIRGSIVGAGSKNGLFMFARGNDSQMVFFQRWNGTSWSGWTVVGCCIPIPGEIQAGTDGDGNLYLIGVNGDGMFYRWSADGVSWTDASWTQFYGSAVDTPDRTQRPGVAVDPDGRLRVTQRFSDGSVRTIRLSRSSFSAWETISAANTAAEVASASYNGRTYVFKLLSGTVQSREWDGSSWGSWTTRLTGVASRITATGRTGIVVAGRPSTGTGLVWASATTPSPSAVNPGSASVASGAFVGKSATSTGPLLGGQGTSALTGSQGTANAEPGYGGMSVSSSDYINPSSKGYTLEQWVNLPRNSFDDWHAIALKGVSCCQNTDEAYALYLNNNGLLHHITAINGVRTACNTTADAVPANTWTHVAVSYDGATMKTYVNGKLLQSCAAASSSIATNTKPLNIGQRPANTGFGALAHPMMGGKIAETAVFNYPLSAERIADHYRARTRVVTTTTLAAPAAPTVTTADSLATVAWSAVSAATRYNVLRNGTYIGSTPSTSFIDTTAVNGTSYSYAIQAANTASSSTTSVTTSATLYAAPHARLTSPYGGPLTQTAVDGFSTFASQGNITPRANGVVVNEAGVYLITSQIHINQDGAHHGWITLSSEPGVRFGVFGNTAGIPSVRLMHQSVIRYLPAGTLIQNLIWTGTLISDMSNPHILSVTRVDGNSTSTPFAAMSSAYGNAAPASAAVPGFAQEQMQGSVTTAADGITAPSDGVYLVAFDLNSSGNHGWLIPGSSSGCARTNVYGNGSSYNYMSYLAVMDLRAGQKAQIFHWSGQLTGNGVNRHRLAMVRLGDLNHSYALAESAGVNGASTNLSGLTSRFGKNVTVFDSGILANQRGMHVFASSISASHTSHGWLWTTRGGGSTGTRFGSTTEYNSEDYAMLTDTGYFTPGEAVGFYQYNGTRWGSTCNPHWLALARVPFG